MPMPPPQPAAKKRNIWLWVLVGCGGLTVLGVLVAVVIGYFLYYTADQVAKNPVRSAAKVVEMINPDIEVISVDEEKQLVTFRDKKTGTVTTVSLEELQKERKPASSDGRSSDDAPQSRPSGASTPNGGGDAGDPPAWVLVYPGAKVIAKVVSGGGGKASGTLTLKADATVDAVLRFYEEKLNQLGFSVTRASVGGGRAVYAKRGSGEMMTVTAAPEEPDDQDDTQIVLIYQSE